jgi:hypothetical protein
MSLIAPGSLKAEVAEKLTLQIDIVVRMITMYEDGVMLPEVIAHGPSHWRNVFSRAFRAGRSLPQSVLDNLADMLFFKFSQIYVWRYGTADPSAILDNIEETTPPTEQEIADAWEIDSGSSEEGRRHFYGPDGSPQRTLEALREMYTNGTKH